MLAFDDAGLVEEEPGQFAELPRGVSVAGRGGQPLDQAVVRIEFENPLGGGVELASGSGTADWARYLAARLTRSS